MQKKSKNLRAEKILKRNIYYLVSTKELESDRDIIENYKNSKPSNCPKYIYPIADWTAQVANMSALWK